MGTPRFGTSEMVEGSAGNATLGNAALRAHEMLLCGEVLNSTLATPPGSPVNGDLYVVATSPTGAWTGKAGKLAGYQNGWLFFDPKGGMVVFDKNAKEWLGYSSVESAWHPLQERWSTTEHWTGKYRDGAKVYSKLIALGTLPNNTSANTAHGISGADFTKPWTVQGWAYKASNIRPLGFNFSSEVIDVVIDGTNVAVTTNFNASSWSAKLRLEYCK